ncbi:MAG: tetratricopeptide repeat protein [Chloroflexia bacterium]|nr:tetratricopeptide repeat protein [Chloroflexia bacterium]
MVSTWMEKLAGKGRRGGSGVLVQISREVVGRRRSIAGAVSEVRHPAVLDALSDDDFKVLDLLIDERVTSDREFATVLARLTHAAAHAKGFDRQTVDAALRLDGMLPADDPGREREKLLRDAYRAAQRVGYVQGGRRALALLGQRAVADGDGERARLLLQQQVALGPEQMDTEDEVESAILLGDLLRRDGDVQTAMELFGRAIRSSERLDFPQGVAQAAVREIDVRRATLDPQTLARMQRTALDAAERSGDVAMQSRLVANYADTLVQLGDLDEAIEQLENGLELSRQIGDLSLENFCLEALSNVERDLGRMQAVVGREADLVNIDVRRGNRPAAAQDSVRHGATLLSLGRHEAARGAYEQAVELARAAGDELLEQRAYGGLGVAYSQLNMPVEALNHLMLALDLSRASNDSAHEAQWLASIGEALWKFDQADDAIKAIHQAIVAARTADDNDLQAGMLSLLGQIYVSNREPGKARQSYSHALDLYRELGEAEEEIQTLSALGALAMESDQPAEAIRLYDDALQLAAHTDQRAAAVRIYGRLARLSQRQGDDEAAIEALEQAASLAETIPDQRALLGQALQHLAVAQDAAGMPAAMNTYEEALVVAREVGDTYGEAMMLVNVGARLIALGANDDGATILEHAIRLTEDLGPLGMKLRQRAEGMLVPVRTQSRNDGGRQFTGRERSVARQREPRPRVSAESMTPVAPPASAIPPAPNEMYAKSLSFHR